MTHARKLKKTIRARARKTGESYASARRQVLQARTRRRPAEPPAPPTAPARRSSPPGGLGDAAAREKTGHGLDHWFGVLDAFGAAEKGHTASARHLFEAHGLPGWYCQGITVAYERARGLRAVNQSGAGGFQVSVSRVVPVPVAGVLEALRVKERRETWLRDADPELVSALRAGLQGPKGRAFAVRGRGDARLRYKWGRSTVELYVQPRGEGKASVVASNEGLPAADLVEPRREAWKAALDALRLHLASR